MNTIVNGSYYAGLTVVWLFISPLVIWGDYPAQFGVGVAITFLACLAFLFKRRKSMPAGKLLVLLVLGTSVIVMAGSLVVAIANHRLSYKMTC
jgi:hypothetical protein